MVINYKEYSHLIFITTARDIPIFNKVRNCPFRLYLEFLPLHSTVYDSNLQLTVFSKNYAIIIFKGINNYTNYLDSQIFLFSTFQRYKETHSSIFCSLRCSSKSRQNDAY